LIGTKACHSLPWFWRELSIISLPPLLGVAVLGFALAQALAEGGSTAMWALVGGLVAGVIAVGLSFAVDRYRGELPSRDNVEIAKRRRRNKQQAQVIARIAVPVAVVAVAFPGIGQVALLAFCAGYLIAWGAWIVVHFARHHAEIERVSNGRV
jgi:hypothetical protein